MSWDGWATNVRTAGGATAAGAAIYDPASGAIWGKCGSFDCSGGMNQYDAKANGGQASAPAVNGVTYMFIRKTQDDDPVNVFKKGADSMFTTKGPSGSRVAIYVKEGKPEPVIAACVNYLRPHV